MRVLNVIQCANLGGMEHSALAMLTRLQAMGHGVRMLSLNPIGGLGPLLEERWIPAEGLPYKGLGGWRSMPLIRQKGRERPCDALIMTGHHLLGMLALRDLCPDRKLLMIHFHHEGVKPRWQWRLIYRVAVRQFPAITFPSDFVRREAERIYPPLAAVSHTIGSPIALQQRPSADMRARWRAEWGLPQDRLVIGNAGWLIPRKRFDIFLHVARATLAMEPEALFLVAGDGPERTKLQALAQELGIADRVRWLGWQGDLTAFYGALDLALFNSDWDAMGLTPLEALSAGVPVVASVVNGGLREVLDQSYGLVFSSHDVEQLARAVVALLRSPRAAQQAVAAGRQRIEKVSNISRYVDRVCELLRMEPGRVKEALTA